jgi:hypothetical protein
MLVVIHFLPTASTTPECFETTNFHVGGALLSTYREHYEA